MVIIMIIRNNTIFFKSDDDCYFKEEAGIKPNTVRFVWEPQELKDVANLYNESQKEVKYIQIQNRRTPHLFFKRQIRDIHWYSERVVFIFSWLHEDKDHKQEGYNAPILAENK